MLEVILIILYVVLFGVLVVVSWRLRQVYHLFHVDAKRTSSQSAALPSVTVCIPARNEVHAMNDCLQSVLASTYEKLEVIVLDDASGDDTSALIKAFASEGIRFVEGKPLPTKWLGKNHALQELLNEASGTYVLFMDVDTRLKPDSIKKIVSYAMKENAAMVSVLPRRDDGRRTSVLFSTMRYFWEVLFHRKEAPATASNLWMIDRKTLVNTWDGFSLFKNAIQPESKISAALMMDGKYRFLLGTEELGVTYEKKWRSQLDTSVRLLFPLLGARIPNSIIAALDLLIIGSPLLIILGGFVFGWGTHQLIAGVFTMLYALVYGSYLQQTRRQGWILGALLVPVIAIQEAILVIASTIQYHRHRVTWKGRQVEVKAPK